jgi:hypothetical protein
MMGCEDRSLRAAASQGHPAGLPPGAATRKCVSTWRAYNDRRWRFEQDLLPADERAPFVCECTSDDCAQAVELTVREYEAAHMSAGWTAVVPGHVVAGDGGRVLERHAHFWVVELRPVFDRDRVSPAGPWVLRGDA